MKMKIRLLEAYNGDCIHIFFEDKNNDAKNILIDGGTSSTYKNPSKKGELYRLIEKIKSSNEKIDLLILTHIDDDHINGLLKWLSFDKKAHKHIGQVWHNSGVAIAKYLEKSPNEELELSLNESNSNYTSVNQGIKFEQYLVKHNIPTKDLFIAEDNLEFLGIKFTILSPSNKYLNELHKKYKKAAPDLYTSKQSNDWDTNIAEFIEEENALTYTPHFDNSVTNRSSIAFILELFGLKYLFLGDSCPILVEQSLEKLGYTAKKPIEAEFLKISHHGSEKNTSRRMLQLIKTENYFISTNGAIHNHPDKRTIARIIHSNNRANIFFNYSHIKDYIFSNQDYEDYNEFIPKLSDDYNVTDGQQ